MPHGSGEEETAVSMTVIRSVDPRSPAHRAGLRPGEKLLEVNGNPVADVLDYKFYTYDPKLTLVLQPQSGWWPRPC